MKNSKTLLPVLAILLCVSLSCTFLKNKFAGAEKPADEFRKVAKLWPVDPKAPLVSPGSLAVRKLAEIDPSVAIFATEIEATERGAMKKVIAENSVTPESNKKKEKEEAIDRLKESESFVPEGLFNKLKQSFRFRTRIQQFLKG